jgi:DNA-directed RNA polymerase subunit L
MELKVIETQPQRLRLRVSGETHTLLNILTEYAWEAKASQASYMIEHPYLSQPEIIVRSKNPKKTLSDAAQIIIDRSKEFKSAFVRSLRK